MMWLFISLAGAFLISFIETSKIYDPDQCGYNFLNHTREAAEKAKHANVKKSRSNRRGGSVFKIWGGKNVTDGEFPWSVVIWRDDKIACSGSLISTKHVATAAHCFMRGSDCGPDEELDEQEIYKRYVIGYGSVCMPYAKDCKAKSPLDKRNVTKVHFYKRFYESQGCGSGKDIAIIELNEPINEEIANYVCLPEGVDPKEIELTAVGWGITKPNRDFTGGDCSLEDPADRLQKLSVGKRTEPELCTFQIKEAWNRTYIDDYFCVPDSGIRNTGGGVVGLHEGRYHIFGVLSFGSDCSLQEYSLRMENKTISSAQVFTSVDYYVKEIKPIIGA